MIIYFAKYRTLWCEGGGGVKYNLNKKSEHLIVQTIRTFYKLYSSLSIQTCKAFKDKFCKNVLTDKNDAHLNFNILLVANFTHIIRHDKMINTYRNTVESSD